MQTRWTLHIPCGLTLSHPEFALSNWDIFLTNILWLQYCLLKQHLVHHPLKYFLDLVATQLHHFIQENQRWTSLQPCAFYFHQQLYRVSKEAYFEICLASTLKGINVKYTLLWNYLHFGQTGGETAWEKSNGCLSSLFLMYKILIV